MIITQNIYLDKIIEYRIDEKLPDVAEINKILD